MVKCPKCKAEIENFTFSAKVVVSGVADLNTFKGKTTLENQIDDYGNWLDEEFYCPECDKLLFKSEDKAKKFLKSK